MSETAPAAPREEATILHVDMDAFFLSVELRERPDLEGRPAAVAAPSGRSVVLSASYAARAYGVRSAMPLAHARALCPPLVVIPPRQQLYRAVSAEVMAVLADVTPVMEQLSVDEAFLDVAGARRRLGPPEHIGHLIRERVRSALGLPCTVGGSAVKFVAKTASTAAKPDGLLIVPPERTLDFLHPLPVGRLWGVGPKAAERLARRGVATIGDLARGDKARYIRIVRRGSYNVYPRNVEEVLYERPAVRGVPHKRLGEKGLVAYAARQPRRRWRKACCPRSRGSAWRASNGRSP